MSSQKYNYNKVRWEMQKKLSSYSWIRWQQKRQQQLAIFKRNRVNRQKIKIIIQIKDSKRTMKNNTKKEYKAVKKQDKINKKVPAQHRLEQTVPFTEGLAPLQNILSATTTKLMGGFSQSQKKIISDQFNKMIKKLKIKLVSPQKTNPEHGFKLETKTQRFQLADPNNCSKETIKKKVFTDRKIISTKSPKTKSRAQGKYSKIRSPKRSSTIKSSQQQIQQNNHSLGSPMKTKKSRFIDMKQQYLNQTVNKNKKTKIYSKDSKKQNYFLLGERFVEINENQAREMESQVIMEQSSHLKDSQLEYVWSQFKEKKKNNRDRIQSEQQVKSSDRAIAYTPKISNHLQEQKQPNNLELNNQSIVEENVNFRYSEENKNMNQDIYKQFYSDLPSVVSPKAGQQKKENNYSIFNIKQGESYSEDLMSPISNKSKKSSKSMQDDVIKTRKNAIELQMKTNRQILTQLLDKNKITKSEFQQHMDLVIEIYDKEMTQIQNLKEMIEMNEQKIDNLIKNTNQSLKISQKLGEVQVQSILQTVFGPYKKQLQDNKNKITEDSNNIFKHSGFLNIQQQPKQCNLGQHQNNNRERVDRFQTQNKKIQNFKHLIENRTAIQLSTIKSNNHQGILTSVISVFQFIKNFLSFIKSYHLNQFLTYVNMPYGYSAEQRLRFMQGYDENQENQKKNIKQTGIIYGLEEVFHPNLLNQFHNSLCYKPLAQSSSNSASWKQVQKIHNKLIFDALNQAINRFRPYYLINGCPYLWTTTQKALTYYFISEECYEELFSKIQMQVLKWSSSLCGLLIPEAVNRIQVQDQSKLGLEKIFQKYTVETECQLLEHRQQKIIKQQKIQIYQSNFQWNFHDEYKTALLYELSSCILQDLSHQMAIFMLFSQSRGEIQQLYYECGVSPSEIED